MMKVRQQTNTPYMNELIKNPATHTIFSRQAAVLQPHHIDELIKNPATHEQFIDDLQRLSYNTYRYKPKIIVQPHHIDELIKKSDDHVALSLHLKYLKSKYKDELNNSIPSITQQFHNKYKYK